MITIKLIQEAKRRYPIGTKYTSASYPDDRMVHTLKKNPNTYRLFGENGIAGHPKGGLLYKDGVWAKIVEEIEYYPNLSQHIGRYIKALVDGSNRPERTIKKGDIGRIINFGMIDFPNYKDYHCAQALTEGYLGVKYELMPEDFAPVPEYVECIQENSYYGELGKIYKVKTWEYSKNDCILEGTTSGSTDKKRFKPSTKEAYDAQFTSKKEFVLPEKWHLKLKPEFAQIICDYVIKNKPNYLDTWTPDNILKNKYISNNSDLLFSAINPYGTEITFEQFKKYILKEENVHPILKLTYKDAIHAETEEQAIALCKLFDSLGLKWKSGISYSIDNNWDTYKESTCYLVKKGEFNNEKFYKKRGYVIHKATDFISATKEERKWVGGLLKDEEVFTNPTEEYVICEEVTDPIYPYTTGEISLDEKRVETTTEKPQIIDCTLISESKISIEPVQSIEIKLNLHKKNKYKQLKF